MRGVIICPDREIELKFAWGLVKSTNNQEETLALWRGLCLAFARAIRQIILFRDSMLTIQKFYKDQNLYKKICISWIQGLETNLKILNLNGFTILKEIIISWLMSKPIEV